MIPNRSKTNIECEVELDLIESEHFNLMNLKSNERTTTKL